MDSITEQRFVDRLIQALASLPQNAPRPLDAYAPVDAETRLLSSPVKN